jgi:MarR family transcriptional regulator, organic hydroperoxide resistance regulator
MTEAAPLDDWQLLAQVSQVYRTLADTFMDQVDMHRAQAGLLCSLYAQDGMTQSEIAEQLSVQGATITNMLQRMEESGWVVRLRDPDDNRLVRVYLTEAGRIKERAIHKRFLEMEDRIFEGVSPENREQLRGMLLQILRNMSAV